MPSTNHLVDDEDDSAWEYEYHETETEVPLRPSRLVLSKANLQQDFYVTLDVSSAADTTRPRTKKKTTAPAPSPPVSTFPAANPNIPDNEDNEIGPSQQGLEPVARPETSTVPTDGAKDTVRNTEPEGRVQILDFHTANPIISYQNQMYSCEWTSTLGTDVLLTTPDPEFQHPSLRETPGVSVLAATSIKLSARPVRIASRPGTNAEETGSQVQTPVPESSSQASSTPAPDQPAKVSIPMGKLPTRARQNQANFLERLIAIKTAKGETDKVTVHTRKVNQGSGWRNQHKALEEQGASDDDPEGTPPIRSRGRGRGRPGRKRKDYWRTMGPRTQKGGLFRDYRPQLWDTGGADSGERPSATPESWDQLKGAGDGTLLPARGEAASFSATPGYQPQKTGGEGRRVSFADDTARSSATPGIQPQQVGVASDGHILDSEPGPSVAEPCDVEMQDA